MAIISSVLPWHKECGHTALSKGAAISDRLIACQSIAVTDVKHHRLDDCKVAGAVSCLSQEVQRLLLGTDTQQVLGPKVVGQ